MTRIVAGRYGGRRLAVRAGAGTRPTTDRVREALFSAVAARSGTVAATADETLAGLAFADLYAGSGAVGLEAASRGASPVLLIEADRRAARDSVRNAAALGAAVEVLSDRVEALAARPAPRAYDVVFADPPYAVPSEAVQAVLVDLLANGWLAADGLVVVERSRRSPSIGWPAGFHRCWARHYGETTLLFGSAG
jgi:16S rRNA (guanine966-N2)-methyltransferase